MKKTLPLCGNLGEVVTKSPTGCRFKHTYVCDELKKLVTPDVHCQSCNKHDAEYDLDKIKPVASIDTDFTRLLHHTPSLPLGGGNGIIYVGGGKYWEGIVTGIRMLRGTGSTLPVEVWFRGDVENIRTQDVEGMGVEFFNIVQPMGGWEAKLFALANTKLDRVLFLDGDAYVVENPEILFNLVNHYAFAFWKDFEGQRKSIKWEKVFPGGDSYNLDPIQGGQFILDRIKCQKLIYLANYLCEHSDYYFKHMFGDQDTWRVALAGMLSVGEQIPVLKIGNARWQNVAFICDYANKPYIVHRCQGKLFTHEHIPLNRVKYSNPQYSLPKEVDVFNCLAKAVGDRKPEEVFSNIYAKRLWGGGSGAGTKLSESQLYIDTVNTLAKMYKWKTAVDVGTGDGLVSSYLRFDSLKCYDCVASLTERNNKLYGIDKKKSYFTLDICTNYDRIDSGDVLLCKDVLHHWPTKLIVSWLDSLIESKKWKHLLLCQDLQQYGDTQDCHLGGYRGLNPKMFPLNRYKIVKTINIHHKYIVIVSTE